MLTRSEALRKKEFRSFVTIIMFKTIQFNSFHLLGVVLGVSLFLLTSCHYVAKNACEISEDDAEKILGSRALTLDDKSGVLPEEGRDMPNVRGCSYVREEGHQDVSSVRWTDIEFKNDQDSQENFERVSAKEVPSSVPGFPKEYMAALGDESFITREKQTGEKVEITVRKGRNIFIVIANLPNLSDELVEKIKTLTKTIADKTGR